MSIEASQGSFTPDSENEFDLGFISGVYDSDSDYGLPYKEIRIDGQELVGLDFDKNGEYRLEYNIDTSDDEEETVTVRRNLDPEVNEPDYMIFIENNSDFWNNRLDTAIFSVDENALQSFIYNSPEYKVSASYTQSEDNGAELSKLTFEDSEEDNSFSLDLGKGSYTLVLQDKDAKFTLEDLNDTKSANLKTFRQNGEIFTNHKHTIPENSTFNDLGEVFTNQNYVVIPNMVEDILDTFGGDLEVDGKMNLDALVRYVKADFPEINYEVVSNESQAYYGIAELYNQIKELREKLEIYETRLLPQDEPTVDYSGFAEYEYFKNKLK